MTLSAAWTRSFGKTEELVIATDSRLRFGMAWDCAPKIIPLPRNDSAICFAGDTEYAYPIMLQVANAVSMHQKNLSRALDITDLRGHILRVIEGMRGQIFDPPKGNAGDLMPSAIFILAGYSWRFKKFKIWALHFKKSENRFVFRSAGMHRKQTAGTKHFFFVGDHTSEARRRLYERLSEKGRLRRGGLDLEPFEVLVDMIRDTDMPEIGGPPQIVKIYAHMNCMPYSVYWPNKSKGKLAFLGRPLLNYEKSDYLAIDPDTLEVSKPPNPRPLHPADKSEIGLT